MNKLLVSKQSWEKYTDSIGDYHPGHHDDEEARRLGLEKVIAPGMWLAAHIERLVPKGYSICRVPKIIFSGRVYDGDSIDVEYEGNGARFVRDGNTVCEINGLDTRELPEAPKIFESPIYEFHTGINLEDATEFNESIGSDENCLLDMHVASLCAPALLEYGRKLSKKNKSKNNNYGQHRSQSFYKHESFKTGPIDVVIGDVKKRKDNRTGSDIYNFNLQWLQSGLVIASGKSVVVSTG